MSLPASHGGLGADLAATLAVLETLARADASTAWTVMIGGARGSTSPACPAPTFDEVFDRPDVIVAGVFNPTGSIDAVDGGYRVTGRWSFASGCEHADVLFGNCVEAIVDGPQLRDRRASRRTRSQIEDTWTVAGLCGTGSHHFHVDGAGRRPPSGRTCRWPTSRASTRRSSGSRCPR